jgi:SRSO17 transposase
VREYVVEHFAAEDAVLVIDETGVLKQGKSSCGVGRQYTLLIARKETACPQPDPATAPPGSIRR